MDTKQAIQQEFIKLYAKKCYDNITIKELCEKTPVARTTFYSYYQNLDELQNDIETTLLKGLTEKSITHKNNIILTMNFFRKW